MIDVEPKDLGSVVQLVAKSEGWKSEEIRHALNPIYIGGDLNPPVENRTPESLIKPLQEAWLTTKERRPTDFNGLKVAVQRLSVIDGVLQTDGVITDYFTAWGLPKADDARDLFAEHERQVVINRTAVPNALYETNIPWAVCTHNVLLDRNGDILMMVRSQSQGFHAGRVSATEEEQMEPTLDFSPFVASFRSFHEELNLIVPPQRMRLLGVALEKGAAYPAYAFVAETDVLARELIDSWKRARDYNENTALFVVPMTQVGGWTSVEEVTPEIWGPHLLAGNVAHDANLRLHATSSWRIELAKRFTQSS